MIVTLEWKSVGESYHAVCGKCGYEAFARDAAVKSAVRRFETHTCRKGATMKGKGGKGKGKGGRGC